jgi:hypothetical protein
MKTSLFLAFTALASMQAAEDKSGEGDWLPAPDGYVWPSVVKDAPEFNVEQKPFASLSDSARRAILKCWVDEKKPEFVEVAEADLNSDGLKELFVGLPFNSGTGGTFYEIFSLSAEGYKSVGGVQGGVQFVSKQNGWYQIKGTSRSGGSHYTRYLLTYGPKGYEETRNEGHDRHLGVVSVRTSSVIASIRLPVIEGSISPDVSAYAVMDLDRDPSLDPEWKEGSFPQIEITDIKNGRILKSLEYFGSAGDDSRPLREHVMVYWRQDSKALAIRIDDRYYTHSVVLEKNEHGKFVEVPLPSYETMTGFKVPSSEELRPRGRSSVEGWDTQGHLVYTIFLSPEAAYQGPDPLNHKILLSLSAGKMTVVKSEPAKDE